MLDSLAKDWEDWEILKSNDQIRRGSMEILAMFYQDYCLNLGNINKV